MNRLQRVTLVGRFVRLEPLEPAHVDGLVAAASGSRDTYALTSVPATHAEMDAYIVEALAMYEREAALPFATVERASGAVVGSTRFCSVEFWRWPEGVPPAAPLPRGPDSVEIGWTWLAARAQRTAINTETKLLMLRHAFETWGVRKVFLKTDRRNARSRAAIERIGGLLDGVLRAHMPAYDGAVRDTALYSILAAEWPACAARLEERLAV